MNSLYPLPYLIPKSLSNTQSLLNSLSQFKVFHLQWIPGHSSLPGNDLVDSLAKAGASLDPSIISVSLPPLIPTTIPLHQFLNSYLHRIGRAETPSCSNCGSEPQDLSHLVLDCPVLDPLRRAIFGHTPSLLDLWSRPWGVARLLGFRRIDPRPHP